MFDVTEINAVQQLADLRPIWKDLVAQTPRADFFRTLPWLEVYWKHFSQRQRLRILVVAEQGRTVSIIPLVVRREWTRLGPFRALTFPLDDWGSFYGPVGAEPRSALLAGLQYVCDTPRDWDYVELRWLDTVEKNDWAASAMREAGFQVIKRVHTHLAMVEINRSWDEYWKSLSKNMRRNCRSKEKKLAREASVEHVRYRPRGEAHGEDDPRWDLYKQCEMIAEKSWQGSSTSGTTITHDEIRPFLRDVHIAAAREGCLDMNLLYVDGHPAAFNYNYFYRGYVSCLRMGYHPDMAKFGVGTVLTARTLQDSFERKDTVFDFLAGSIEIKKKWKPTLTSSLRYSHLPRRLGRLQLLRLKRWASKETLQ